MSPSSQTLWPVASRPDTNCRAQWSWYSPGCVSSHSDGKSSGFAVTGPASTETGRVWTIENGITWRLWKAQDTVTKGNQPTNSSSVAVARCRSRRPAAAPTATASSASTTGWSSSGRVNWACKVRPGSSPMSKPPCQRTHSAAAAASIATTATGARAPTNRPVARSVSPTGASAETPSRSRWKQPATRMEMTTSKGPTRIGAAW